MLSKQYIKRVIEVLNPTLKEQGFKRSVNHYHRSNLDVVQLIKLQSSQQSTSTVLKLTVNIQMYSMHLYLLQDTGLSPIQCLHYNYRLGFYLDPPYDKWWTIDSDESATNAGKEMLSIITEKVLQKIDSLRTTKDLLAAWKSEKGMGLTEYQRQEYIKLLESNEL